MKSSCSSLVTRAGHLRELSRQNRPNIIACCCVTLYTLNATLIWHKGLNIFGCFCMYVLNTLTHFYSTCIACSTYLYLFVLKLTFFANLIIFSHIFWLFCTSDHLFAHNLNFLHIGSSFLHILYLDLLTQYLFLLFFAADTYSFL